MSNDPQDYEEATGTPAGAGKKHYQISVPSFTETDGATPVGSSFLRLGSSFSGNEINNNVSQAIKDAETRSVALAGLVGDAATVLTENITAETSGGENEYTGTFLPGFADDTRYRPGTDNRAARRAETAKLLTKGGWWDHSDGNRITTTKGDKVEVIQGNYKMVVLGRQDPSSPVADIIGKTFITDVSGGFFEEQNACPTPCIKTVEYKQTVQDPTNGNAESEEWTLYQDNGNGNVHTMFGWGDITDTYEVRNKKTQIGKWGDASVRTIVEDKLWLASSTNKTDVRDDITTHVDVGGKIDNYTNVKGIIQNNTIAHAITALQTAPAITNVNTAANIFNFNLGIQQNVNVAPLQINMNILGLILELTTGYKLALGLSKTRLWGLNTSLDLSRNVVAASRAEANAKRSEANALKDELNSMRNDIAISHMSLETAHTRISNVQTALASAHIIT